MLGKPDIFDSLVDVNNSTPSDDKECKMRAKKVTCLKVIGMTVLVVLAVLIIKDTSEKVAVQTERNDIRNKTSSQSSNSSILPDNSAKSSDTGS